VHVTSQGDGRPESDDPGHGIVNPRLSDALGLVIRQDEVDFVVPHLREDLPLALDPFLLWKSDQEDYRELHAMLLSFLEAVRVEALAGRTVRADLLLEEVKEPRELGLGYSEGTKIGNALGPKLRSEIIEMFRQIPQMGDAGLDHIEILSLLVPNVAEDRVGDITASVIKKWLADFTTARCKDLGIPTRKHRLVTWDPEKLQWRPFDAQLAYNPADELPLLLAPLDLLRRLPWINYPDYCKSTYTRLVLSPTIRDRSALKKRVRSFNRANYDTVRGYVASREQQASACHPDPLFTPLRLDTLRRKAAEVRTLPTGRIAGADKKFETLVFDLLSSLLYPQLDLAANQVRTFSGAHVRDIIFYNDGKLPFLQDLREAYGAKQLVFELKNVDVLDTEHVNQLYRYLDDEDMGRCGILLARRPPPRNVQQNIIDLHSSKRAAIICLDDSDLDLMVQLLDSNRLPVEALRKKYVDFTRRLPK
jgi:hypothetical protein